MKQGILGFLTATIFLLIASVIAGASVFIVTKIAESFGASIFSEKTLTYSIEVSAEQFYLWELHKILNAPVSFKLYKDGTIYEHELKKYFNRDATTLHVLILTLRDDEIGDLARDFIEKSLGKDGWIGYLYYSIEGIKIQKDEKVFEYNYNETTGFCRKTLGYEICMNIKLR